MLFFALLYGLFAQAQDIGVSSITLVEGTLNTGISSVTYELCPTNSISLDIVLENFATSADTVSKVTIGITGVNSSVKTEYTISSTINLAGNSSVTLTYPDDFNAVTPIFSL